MAGFKLVNRRSGGGPNIHKIVSADAELHVGDLVNVEAGQADLAVTADAALAGVVLGPVDADHGDGDTLTLTAGTDKVLVVTDVDAVYAVEDANARSIGDTLDISGLTGAQGVGASVNADLIVVADSTADQATLVKIQNSNHVFGK